MIRWVLSLSFVIGAMLSTHHTHAAPQQAGSIPGSIQGVLRDKEFGVPIPEAKVIVVELRREALTGTQGEYLLGEIPAGRYTLVFEKAGYVRELRSEVVVSAGSLTQVDATLAGEFIDLDEFVVQDLLSTAGGTEAGLLSLRYESPALLDSISSELMSRAGASDAAGALRLVSGATVEDGKFAVIRGLPDRYVSSQLNGVRLPSADEDTRAVELDQFPSAVIDSVQVSKTFTPDQQGDASGGAVDVRLRDIPVEAFFQVRGQLGYHSEASFRDDFLTYRDGGVNTWGRDNGGRDPQLDRIGENWDGAVGVSEGQSSTIKKWSIAGGGRSALTDELQFGGFLSFFYDRGSTYYDNGRDDSYWVDNAGEPMTPRISQGGLNENFFTSLFDITQGQETVQWGGLSSVGVESENHQVGLTYLFTHTAMDTATLAEDTRGKLQYFPRYDPDDPESEGNGSTADDDSREQAPYLRLETLDYNERETDSLQLGGQHTLRVGEFGFDDVFVFSDPELSWVISDSSASFDQPDKRQFGAAWLARSYNPGIPPFIEPFFLPPEWIGFKPSANFTLGNLQRIFKTIDEDSEQYDASFKFPFQQWTRDTGYLLAGRFEDGVDRFYDQDTFSNFGEGATSFLGNWEDYWSAVFPFEDHPITDAKIDVDYSGRQSLRAWYAMLDLPLVTRLNLIGGYRLEKTKIETINFPEEEALWFPEGAGAPDFLEAGEGDVLFERDDDLPSVGLVYEPIDEVTLRGAYSETVARPTFKELTPILQQEFLGGPIFIGNPNLRMGDVENYDFRVDHRPYEGGLFSVSWFRKELTNPIEYVQRISALFDYTTAVNYPKGELEGFEFEMRQEMGHLLGFLEGISVGANATFIDSEVILPADEAAGFEEPGIRAPITSRDMTNAPEYLYNLFGTWDFESTGTQLGLFYTLQGDTLITGAGQANMNFLPNVYATAFDTLNFSLNQRISKFLRLQFQAKNLTNPEVQTVYRSEYIGDDVLKTSFKRGVELTLALTAEFSF